MYQISIEPLGKTKARVYLDGQFAFVLYKSELSRYGIKDGDTMDPKVAESLKTEIVLKRAKQKALKLLGDMDRTKAELKERLLRAEFTEEIADLAVAYAESFGYLDDERYVENYILSRKGTKSRRELYAELSRKKIEKEMTERIMEACYGEEDTADAIKKLLKKKKYHPETAGPEEKRKLYAYLARKGFGYRDIQSVLQLPEWDV